MEQTVKLVAQSDIAKMLHLPPANIQALVTMLRLPVHSYLSGRPRYVESMIRKAFALQFKILAGEYVPEFVEPEEVEFTDEECQHTKKPEKVSLNNVPANIREPRTKADAETAKAYWTAKKLEQDVLQTQGLLTMKSLEEKRGFEVGRTFRNRLLTLPARIASELATISDSWETEQFLQKAFRKMLEELFEELSFEDSQVDYSFSTEKILEPAGQEEDLEEELL